MNTVVRLGDTVRRPVPSRAQFVHGLLQLFERAGWPGAPRFLGIDGEGREILEYVEGHIAWEPSQASAVAGKDSLIRVAELVREFHNLTAGSDLASGDEVVCHNDLSPKNTVYRDQGAGLRPVAFIDWDLAAPGRRIEDVAHLCWQYLGMAPGADVAQTGRLIRAVCDGYGLADRSELLEVVLWWQDRCWRGIDSAADAGDPAMTGLRDRGLMLQVQLAYQWTWDNRSVFARALSAGQRAPR